MATSDMAFQIGAYFISQYYQVLCDKPESSHRFYDVSSTMTLIDAVHTEAASTMLDIHELLTSLRVTKVEVTELNVQKSWNGGIFFIVAGIVRSRNFHRKTKFSQSFFLAPQDNGYFVLNDILRFQDQEVVNQHPAPELADNVMVDSQVPAYNPHDVQPVISDSSYEPEKTSEYFNSLHTQDKSPIDKYSLLDNLQHEDLQFETVVEEASVEQSSPLESVVNNLEDPIHWPAIALGTARVEELAAKPAAESAAEPASLSYASILRESKGQSSQSSVPRQPAVRQSMPADDILVQEELTSVFVRRLPLNVTNADLEKELKNFGKIRPNGVLIRNNTETGVCFAFVEFEDLSGAHNAIKASPIKLLDQQVFIHEKRGSSSTSTTGGELTSVFVESLPSNVTNADLEKEFKNFGEIKPNGVTIRKIIATGVCFAFVEFEDLSGAHNAIKASPIKLLDQQVYIHERIVSSSTSTRGGDMSCTKRQRTRHRQKPWPRK